MGRDELALFTGGKEEFPPFYRVLKKWAAGHADHSKIDHLLSKNPDGHQTEKKLVLREALASSQEIAQLTKDCPNTLGMLTNAGNPTATAKLLLDARRDIYQSSFCNLLSVKFHHIETEFLGIHDIGHDECGESRLRTLPRWGKLAEMMREKIMDTALALVDEAIKAITLKRLDCTAQAMVVHYNDIAPD